MCFLLNLRVFLIPTYFDHGTCMHHRKHALDAPAAQVSAVVAGVTVRREQEGTLAGVNLRLELAILACSVPELGLTTLV